MQLHPSPKLIETAEMCGKILAEKYIDEGSSPEEVKASIRAGQERILAPECRSREDFETYLAAYLRGAGRALGEAALLN